MKTPEEIVAKIDAIEQHMLRRPSMYARSVESFEDQIRLLEALREFIVSDEDVSSAAATYRDYEQRIGKCHAMSFVGKRLQNIQGEFIEFFAGYLESQGRSARKERSDDRAAASKKRGGARKKRSTTR